MTHCPTCGQRIVKAARRVCADCGKTIARHDKYFFGEDGRVRHRLCDNPKSYVPEQPTGQPNLIEQNPGVAPT